MTRTMTGYSAKSIDELPTLWDGFAKLVRAGLDITAFGANIMDLPPDYSTTSHDESESGQQELYVALRGSGSVDVDGASLPLDADHLVRVDAGTARVLSSGPNGLRVLCIGGVPGGVYEPPRLELNRRLGNATRGAAARPWCRPWARGQPLAGCSAECGATVSGGRRGCSTRTAVAGRASTVIDTRTTNRRPPARRNNEAIVSSLMTAWRRCRRCRSRSPSRRRP